MIKMPQSEIELLILKETRSVVYEAAGGGWWTRLITKMQEVSKKIRKIEDEAADASSGTTRAVRFTSDQIEEYRQNGFDAVPLGEDQIEVVRKTLRLDGSDEALAAIKEIDNYNAGFKKATRLAEENKVVIAANKVDEVIDEARKAVARATDKKGRPLTIKTQDALNDALSRILNELKKAELGANQIERSSLDLSRLEVDEAAQQFLRSNTKEGKGNIFLRILFYLPKQIQRAHKAAPRTTKIAGGYIFVCYYSPNLVRDVPVLGFPVRLLGLGGYGEAESKWSKDEFEESQSIPHPFHDLILKDAKGETRESQFKNWRIHFSQPLLANGTFANETIAMDMATQKLYIYRRGLDHPQNKKQTSGDDIDMRKRFGRKGAEWNSEEVERYIDHVKSWDEWNPPSEGEGFNYDNPQEP